jgi:hypothetical protein
MGLPWSWPVACCPGIQGAKVLLPGQFWGDEKIYANEDDGPTASSSKVVDDNIMGNPYNEDHDNWENVGEYDLNPTPHLDAKQEAEVKALILAAKSGDGAAKSQITKVLQGAQGKRRGKWHNRKPPQTDFETAVMQLWKPSDGPSKAKQKQAKKNLPRRDSMPSQTKQQPPRSEHWRRLKGLKQKD